MRRADLAAELRRLGDVWQEVHSLTLYQRPELAATKKDVANFGAKGFASVTYENIGFAKS
ncbi:hypothetical protein [Krasilnikovia sp. M28-CT-15]|uniref:hypothetical protein n=1 Tax=Krasilnikovia sp. M28-CT-15 TaxID=3373540 RepID=UPI00399CBFA9